MNLFTDSHTLTGHTVLHSGTTVWEIVGYHTVRLTLIPVDTPVRMGFMKVIDVHLKRSSWTVYHPLDDNRRTFLPAEFKPTEHGWGMV